MASGAKRYQAKHGVLPTEIEPGRRVHNDWDSALRETWADRKARRAPQGTASSGGQSGGD